MKFYNTMSTERVGYDFYCDIAERMVEARKKHGWDQEDLAKAAKIKLSRIRNMERVKIRFTLRDVETIAKALGVSVDWLIDAQLDRGGKACLYLVWNEKYRDCQIYQEASSARMAFLKAHHRISCELALRWFDTRDRAVVKLVGVPVESAELEAKFPKRDKTEDEQVEPDAKGGT